MMVEEINESVKKNRNWAVLGAGVGLVLLVGYFGYELAMTPERPSIQGATPHEVVAYVSNPRGLRKLADIEQRQFLEEWRAYLTSDEAAKAALKKDLEALDSDERKRFVAEMMHHFKSAVLSDAKQYNQLAAQERNRFVQKKAAEFEGQESFAKELAKVFSAEGMSQEKLLGWARDNTTAREREIIMPYLDALDRVAQERRKQQRNQPVAARP